MLDKIGIKSFSRQIFFMQKGNSNTNLTDRTSVKTVKYFWAVSTRYAPWELEQLNFHPLCSGQCDLGVIVGEKLTK